MTQKEKDKEQTKIIYLHIGSPKTGTSALQSFFSKNHSVFKKKMFCYPMHQIDENGGNGRKIVQLMRNKGLDRAREYFWKLVNECEEDNVLISSEGFYRHPNEVFKIVSHAKIIIYFRNEVDMIASAYNQHVKRANEKDTFSKALHRMIKVNGDIYGGNIIFEWARRFGFENVFFRVYEKEQFINGNIFYDFLDTIQLSYEEFRFPEKRVNAAYCMDALEYKLLLNNLFVDIEKKYLNMIEKALQKYSQNYFANGGKKFTLYSDEELKKVEAIFESNNKKLLESFKPDNNTLFKGDSSESKLEKYGNLSADKIVELTEFILSEHNELEEELSFQLFHGIYSHNKRVRKAAYELSVLYSKNVIDQRTTYQ